MRKSIKTLLMGATAAIALSSQTLAATELNITCRCVIGGVNSGMAEWIQNAVIPAFTEK